MAHRRTFRGRGISQSQRRKKTWIPITAPSTIDGLQFGDQSLFVNFQAAALGNSISPAGQTVGFLSTVGEFPEESTILRIRGSLVLPKNDVEGTTPGSLNVHALGIGVMERTAAEQGAVPNPASPEGAAWDGWMFYRSTMLPPVEAESSIFDVKSMRKVEGGYAVIIVAGTFMAEDVAAALGTVPAVNVFLNARALVLLP